MSAFYRCDNCQQEMHAPVYALPQKAGMYSAWHCASYPTLEGDFCSLTCLLARGAKVQRAEALMHACGPIDAAIRQPFDAWRVAMDELGLFVGLKPA